MYLHFDSTRLLASPTYDPNRLTDLVMARCGVTTDAALCKLIDVFPPVISKIRNKRNPISGTVLLRMHHVSKLPIDELRVAMGDPISIDSNG